jgi:AcrR family transcriptional regulator
MATSIEPPRGTRSLPCGRRERRRQEVRERLYRAALSLFAERGYAKTTVEDITEKADVGKGTFFNYFPSKEHVLATFGSQRIAIIEAALAQAQQGPVIPVMRKMAADLAGHCSESPALLRAIYAAHTTCEPVRAELHKRLQISRRMMTEMFQLAQDQGEIRRDIPAAELARLSQLVLFGVTLAWSVNPHGSVRDAASEVWELFSLNLRADPKGRVAGASDPAALKHASTSTRQRSSGRKP